MRKRVKINYVFRSKRRNEHSIENVFNSLVPYVEEAGFDVECSYLPCERYNNIKAVRENIKYVRSLTGDIFHVTGEVNFVIPFLKGMRVLTLHDFVRLTQITGVRRKLYKLMFLDIPLKEATKITCISQKTKNELENLYRGRYESILISDPVDNIYRYNQKVFSSSLPTILLVGTRYNKNIERVIEAVVGIECQLLVIGKLSDAQEQLLKKTGVKYKNLSGLSNEDVYKCYVESDMLCFPSIYEGFGMPIIEAQRVGRPVITSNIPPMCDVGGDAAFIVDPYSVADIRNGILRLINNPDLRNELTQKGIGNSWSYSAETIANEYISLYRLMLGE